jgi:hypothetical protein
MDVQIPATVAEAPLPVSYEDAKAALAKCAATDEVAEWEAKAVALATYARMMQDKTLLNTALRIRGRAVKRFGELYEKLVPAKPGPKPDGVVPFPVGQGTKQSEKGVATDKQVAMASNVAAIPAAEFEALIESPNPPSKTALSQIGAAAKQAAKPAPDPQTWLKGRTPEQFNTAMTFTAAVERFAKDLAAWDPNSIKLDDGQAKRVEIALERIDTFFGEW